uniref:Uncharacterized protein n=1 Tax=Anguilla anguilla TaxID=7936 RepID=A0A0E9QCR2_ANGAN
MRDIVLHLVSVDLCSIHTIPLLSFIKMYNATSLVHALFYELLLRS